MDFECEGVDLWVKNALDDGVEGEDNGKGGMSGCVYDHLAVLLLAAEPLRV